MKHSELSRPPGTFTRRSAVNMSSAQRRAGFAAATVLFVAGLWTLHEFLPALVWAVVIAIGVWPLFERAARRWPRYRTTLLPGAVVLAILIMFVVPITLVAVPLAQDAHAAAAFIQKARQSGVPAPTILNQLPFGERLTSLWQANLGQPGRLDEFSSRFAQGQLTRLGRRALQEGAHRAVLLGFMLLALFLLLREAEAVVVQLKVASRRAFGPAGESVGRQMIRSVKGTVNGLVLVGLVEGAIMTVIYFAVGAPHAALFGLVTALLAMVPFGAAVALGAAGIVLLAVNKVIGAAIVIVLGATVTFVADHFFRPVLIGGATRLPFLWVLLGILGGVTAFGLLGLFLGPAVLAALILLWREWVGSEEGPLNPKPAATSAADGTAEAPHHAGG